MNIIVENINIQNLVNKYINENNIKPKISTKMPNIDAGVIFIFDEENLIFYNYGNINKIIKSKKFETWLSNLESEVN